MTWHIPNPNGKALEFDSVVPFNWQFAQTYEGSINF
jgi:hypothetical protein